MSFPATASGVVYPPKCDRVHDSLKIVSIKIPFNGRMKKSENKYVYMFSSLSCQEMKSSAGMARLMYSMFVVLFKLTLVPSLSNWLETFLITVPAQIKLSCKERSATCQKRPA